jgi:glycosyltransferase involved in cell wall biosynthesis
VGIFVVETTEQVHAVGGPSYRVLMIAPTSFFADYGCHVRILEEVRILQKLGHRVTVVSYHNGNDVPEVDIRRTLPIPWRRDYEVGSSRHKIAFDALLSLKSLEVVLREKFDIIHAHLHEGALIGQVLSKLTGTPMIFDFQGSLTEEMLDHGFLPQKSPFFGPLRKLETWLDRKASYILTSSLHAEKYLVEHFGCDPERVQTLPDCVNSDTFRPAWTYPKEELRQLRQALGIPEDRFLFVYLGLLAKQQGISHLLRAMQKVIQVEPKVHLLLMGFPGIAIYQQLSQELGIADHVTMPGRIPYIEAPRYLALGDAAVAPKLSTTEGSGKLLNYMALGLPTVAFATPVAQEYLGREGLLAVPGDVDDLAAKLSMCLPQSSVAVDLAGIRDRLRQRAVQHFSWDQAGQKIVGIYNKVLMPAKVTHPVEEDDKTVLTKRTKSLV